MKKLILIISAAVLLIGSAFILTQEEIIPTDGEIKNYVEYMYGKNVEIHYVSDDIQDLVEVDKPERTIATYVVSLGEEFIIKEYKKDGKIIISFKNEVAIIDDVPERSDRI